MIKTKKVTIKEEKDKIIKAKCDWCGKDFKKDMIDFKGWGSINIHFGYGSSYDDTWIGEVCDKCFEKYFKPKLREPDPNLRLI